MKKYLSIIILIALSRVAVCQGLIFEEEVFNNGVHIEMERSITIPEKYSLKNYTPYIYTQQNSTCVAVSVAYASSIMNAILNKVTDKGDISAAIGSPHWIYYRNKDVSDEDCGQGLAIEKVMTDVLNNGIAPMYMVEYPNYYPFKDLSLCNYYPNSYADDGKVASLNKPDDIFRLSEIEEYKLALSNDLPIVFGMKIQQSFGELKKTSIWKPDPLESKLTGYGHAMVVVGYDDEKYGGAFEIMNSWGENWANKGYVWITYNDFKKFALGGYAFFKETKLGATITSDLNSGNNVLDADIKLSKEKKLRKNNSKKWNSIFSN